MNPFPTGTVTFLFTDIEGSTSLWEQNPEPMRVALARHDAILREAIHASDGYVVKTTGDGVMAAFHTATDGLNAALLAQLALGRETWQESVKLRVRMGLHTGAAELREGDYFGPVLNRCARLMAAGHGGQVLLSDATQELSRDSLPSNVSLRSLGEHRLKDLTRPETVYQLQHPDLVADFPSLRTLNNAPNNLPQQLTSFVGREKALAEVSELLTKTRLLTLTAAGGTGKTRLSLQVAADSLDSYPEGVWQVELASLSEPALVPQTVAGALGIKEQAGQSIAQTLVDSLGSRRLLLILDNCEHLISACAQLATTILRSCPGVRILATSREPLGIGGEVTYRVSSLSLPDPKRKYAIEALSQYEAVRLFVDRAQSVKLDFAVTNANAPALAQICYRLDGIPLALELAAARIRSLAPEQMVDKLDSRFRLLTGGDRSALPRQQTLRALIDWSYDLLGDNEKTLLARLSLFVGGWTLAAAETVCGFDPIEDWETLDLLTSLADKSLILVEEDARETRYRMQESIRQYATEKLLADTLTPFAEMQIRHRDFYAALSGEAEPHLSGPDQLVWLERLEAEQDNLRATLDSCAASDAAEAARTGLRVAGALWLFWWMRSYISEGREQLGRALSARPAVPPLLPLDATGSTDEDEDESAVETKRLIAVALRGAGSLAWVQGDYAAAQTQVENALRLFREIDNKRGIARSLMSLGTIAFSQEDHARARLLYEEGLSVFREIGDKSGIAFMMTNLGNIALQLEDYATARSLYEECVTLLKAIGDTSSLAKVLLGLGSTHLLQGDKRLARTLLSESLEICRKMGDRWVTAHGLTGLARICSIEGNVRSGVLLWAASSMLRESIGASLPPNAQAEIDAEAAKARESLGDSAFDAAWAEGAALSWEQAVALALGEKGETEITL